MICDICSEKIFPEEKQCPNCGNLISEGSRTTGSRQVRSRLIEENTEEEAPTTGTRFRRKENFPDTSSEESSTGTRFRSRTQVQPEVKTVARWNPKNLVFVLVVVCLVGMATTGLYHFSNSKYILLVQQSTYKDFPTYSVEEMVSHYSSGKWTSGKVSGQRYVEYHGTIHGSGESLWVQYPEFEDGSTVGREAVAITIGSDRVEGNLAPKVENYLVEMGQRQKREGSHVPPVTMASLVIDVVQNSVPFSLEGLNWGELLRAFLSDNLVWYAGQQSATTWLVTCASVQANTGSYCFEFQLDLLDGTVSVVNATMEENPFSLSWLMELGEFMLMQ